jgi:hypothetical protein
MRQAPLQRHQVLLRRGDLDALAGLYRPRSKSSVLRELVRRHLRAAEARKAAPPNAGEKKIAGD